MKDFTKKQYESSRPSIEAKDGIDFCLKRLYEDTKKDGVNEVCKNLTYEELIGVLLVARDTIDRDYK